VPPPFQEIVDRCYDELGQPVVTFESFWGVYCDLRDKVEAAIPPEIVTGLNESIFSEPGGDGDGSFALEGLKAPDLYTGNSIVIDVDPDVDVDEELFSISFTIDNDQDQLY
jgi:hypothetical protein